MNLSPWRLIFKVLKESCAPVLGLSLLATLPPEILAEIKGWNAMNPGGPLSEAAWFPVSMLCQLALLRILGKALNPAAGSPQLLGRALASALGAEILLGLRFCALILLCAIPALAVMAAFGLESPLSWIAIAILALAGAVPCFNYALHRFFATPIVLWQGLNASASLAESARMSKGKLKPLLWNISFLSGIALILEAISSDSLALAALALPLGFLLSNAALAWAYHRLTL